MMYSFEKAAEHCFIEEQQKTLTNPFGSHVKNVLMLEMTESQVNSPFPRGQVERDHDERCEIFGLSNFILVCWLKIGRKQKCSVTAHELLSSLSVV